MLNSHTAAGTHMSRCSICARKSGKLNCPACARAAVYPHRLAQAHCLVERGSYHRQACALIDSDARLSAPVSMKAQDEAAIYESKKSIVRTGLQNQTTGTRERTDIIIAKVSDLRHQMLQFRDLARKKRESLDRRRANFRATQAAQKSWQDGTLDALKKGVRRAASKHASIQSDIVSARADLCREAATLAGLQQRQQRPADSSLGEAFVLGGSPLFDLREMHNISAPRLTNAMVNISRLLMLSCHYLHIRLPAQLLLPHRNHTLPSIFSPLSSYDSRTLSPSSSTASTPRDPPDGSVFPRARPLWADRKLSILAKEDPNAYSRVVEAASLLAWNIAWLCRVQGIIIATEDWSDVTAIDRNLWLLLRLGPDQRARLGGRNTSNAAPSQLSVQGLHNAEVQAYPPSFLASSFGVFSHGVAFNFLESAAFTKPPGADLTASGWLFSHPSRVSDHLKAYLQAEMSGLDWELLDDGDTYRSAAVGIHANFELVNSRGHTKRTHNPSSEKAHGGAYLSGDNDRTPSRELDISDSGQPRNAGSGWTKLKNRTNLE